MPTFDFSCAANGRTFEVLLRIGESLATWGELWECAGWSPGETPANAPVEKIVTRACVITQARLGSGAEPIDMRFTSVSKFQ